MTDEQLLAEFVERQSQEAFAQLMSRYAPLVYAAARRQVANAQADDVTQAVFILLSTKAPQLRGRAPLAGWLLKVTHFVALEAVRRERRAKRREHAAALAMSETQRTEDPALWDELRPVIDRAMLRLRPADRDVVVLRFFQSMSLSQVGSAVGISEDAARKRVDRAMQRLRQFLQREGVGVETAALASALAIHGLENPPTALLTAKASASSVSLSKGAILLMAAKTKIAIGVVVGMLLIGGGGTSLYYHYAAQKPVAVVVHKPAHVPGFFTSSALSPPADKQGHFVVAATLDRQGRLWIGTEDQGLWVLQDEAWKHVVHPGQNNAYSIASDLQGRLWVGHCRGGVSVYDGNNWKDYDVLSGPLGQHVIRIVVCPASSPHGPGDVWMATELGLARYSVATNSWSYFTRADGLPSDQASCLAFNAAGDLYVGTQCDGLAIARAADDYRTWQTVRGPIEPPAQSHGDGFPCNSINAILVTKRGTVLVGTNHGLAIASAGANWTFMRGKDWIAKVKESIDGPPPNWKPAEDAILAEDFVSALAEDSAGRVWIGYRIKGCQCLSPDLQKVLYADNPKRGQYCQWILPIPGRSPMMGSYGNGIAELKGPKEDWEPVTLEEPAPPASLPSPAPPPEEGELARLVEKVQSSQMATEVAAFLGEDWATQGDWIGRYGRQRYAFPYGTAPDSSFATNPGNGDYACSEPHAGLRANPPGGFYYYPDRQPPENRNMPFLPWESRRLIFEWNDGGWRQNVFNSDFEGPDLWLDVQVPAGSSRVTLYHYIPGEFNGANRRRDFTVELLTYQPDMAVAERAPVLADARVLPSQDGSYRTFLVSQGHYWIHIKSDYSYGATLQAVFLDRPDVTASAPYDSVPVCLNGLHFDPPQAPPVLPTDSSRLRAARALWAALDTKLASTANLQLPYRTLAYRAASADHADGALLANWRWNLHLWTTQDREQWDKVMADAREDLPTTHPGDAQVRN